MKSKLIWVKCDECGKHFIANGIREDGLPNGVGIALDEHTLRNVCTDCIMSFGGGENDERTSD